VTAGGAHGDAVRRTGRRFALWLSLICAVGLGVRIAFVLLLRQPHMPFPGDSFIYSASANLVADGKGFVEPFSGLLTRHTVPTASHPPLYILWLAVAAFVDPRSNTSQLTFVLWSCVLGTGTIALCGLAGREIAGDVAGLFAGALAAVYPNAWVHDGMLLSETMALFTAAGVLLFAYRFWRRPSVWRAVWLGVWCGAMALARSELLLAAALVLVPLLLFAPRETWARRLRWFGAGVAATAIVLAPWLISNAVRFEKPVFLSTNFGPTLAASNCRTTYYGRYIGFKSYDCSSALDRKVAREHPAWASGDESVRDDLLRAEAAKYIRAHASRVPLVVLARVGRILGVFQPFQEVGVDHLLYEQARMVTVSLVVSFWILGAIAVVGGVVLRRRGVPVWPTLAVPVAVVIAVALTFGQLRYRAPAEASVIVLAAVALEAGFQRWRSAVARTAGAEPEPIEPVPVVSSG